MMNMHPTAERLEAFVEGSVESADRVIVESHLLDCARCRTDVEEWRSLFAALSALPSLEPSTGFADRVMSGVRVGARRRWQTGWQTGWQSAWQQAAGHVGARAGALAARATPSSRFGWSLVAALITLPVVIGAGLVAWLVTRSYLTPEALWVYTRDVVINGLQGVGSTAIAFVMQSELAGWATATATQFVNTAGLTGVGVVVGMAGALTMASVWILYRNLFRTPTRQSSYVNFSF